MRIFVGRLQGIAPRRFWQFVARVPIEEVGRKIDAGVKQPEIDRFVRAVMACPLFDIATGGDEDKK